MFAYDFPNSFFSFAPTLLFYSKKKSRVKPPMVSMFSYVTGRKNTFLPT